MICSEVILSALYDAPLLATWQYGLGRTAAFTSDLHGHWSRQWLEWSQFPRFASQLARWIERPTGGDILHPRISVTAGRASVQVDAYDAVGTFVNGLAMEGIVLRPGGGRTEIPMTQTGPGLYEGSFDAMEVGDYLVTLAPKGSDVEGGSSGVEASASAGFAPLTVGVSVPYSDEFRILGVNTDLLKRLAALTGGRVIASSDDAASIAAVADRQTARGSRRGGPWQILLLVAALLFLVDIAARRLTMPEWLKLRLVEARSARAAVRARASARGPAEPRLDLSLDELTGMVSRAREEERRKLRERVSTMSREGHIDPDLAAYLYIARLRSKKAEPRK